MIRNGNDGANPQQNDAIVKPVTDASSNRLRPKFDASQPVIGRIIAFATKYDVNVQVASSVLAERLPAICGSDTFTTVVSSTSMKVLDMTAIATSHGLISGIAWELEAIYGIRTNSRCLRDGNSITGCFPSVLSPIGLPSANPDA
jgi:hypothetical protein